MFARFSTETRSAGLSLVLVGLLAIACKEPAPAGPATVPGEAAPPVQESGLVAASEPAAPPPPPAKEVNPHELEASFATLTRLSFEGFVEAPSFAGTDDSIASLRRADAESCASLAVFDLEGRHLPTPDRQVEAATRVGPAQWLVQAPKNPREHCRLQLRPWRVLDNQSRLWTLDAKSELAWTKASDYVGMPDLSPDQKLVAFVQMVEGDPEVFVASLKAPQPLRLSHAMGLDAAPHFSQDGARVLWTASRPRGRAQVDAWKSLESTRQIRPLPTEIWSAAIDGSDLQKHSDFGAHSFGARLDAQGRLWFNSDLADPARKDQDIYRIDAGKNAAQALRITHSEGFDGQPALNASATKLAFVSSREGGSPALYLATLAAPTTHGTAAAAPTLPE